MILNRQLGVRDYVGALKRHKWAIIIPALVGPLLGYLISFAVSPKYTAQTTVLVEGPKFSDKMVPQLITEDVMQRIATMQQQVTSRARLQPMIERLGLAKPGDNIDDLVSDIRTNMAIAPVPVDPSAKNNKPAKGSDLPGFFVQFTAKNPAMAAKLANELTGMLLTANIEQRTQVATGQTEFFARQLQDAKRQLDEMDGKLAAFKRQYGGQLPGDEDTNMKMLMALNSQLDSSTATLNRAQQDKTFAESTLAQQLAAWKSSQNSTSPQALEQQLSALQNQLMQLQARYTDDHPDVVKAKRDVAELKRKLSEINAAAQNPGKDDENKVNLAEPPEIRQLRVQIHQYEQVIEQAVRDQKRLQQQISVYQGKLAISPQLEEQYKQLTRDYDIAQKNYQDLLAKQSATELTAQAESQQQGEVFRLLNSAVKPDDPSFPNRLLFAGGGFAAGLGIGFSLLLVRELKDQSIRTEPDVEAVLELPTLISLPWVGVEEAGTHGKRGKTEEEQTPVGV